MAAAAGIKPAVESCPLEFANTAIRDLKASRIRGKRVLSFEACQY